MKTMTSSKSVISLPDIAAQLGQRKTIKPKPKQKRDHDKQMEDLYDIVINQQREIRTIKELIGEKSGEDNLKRRKLWRDKAWTFDQIDHDNNPATPDKIIWKDPKGKIYATDGYVTGDELKRKKLTQDFVDRYLDYEVRKKQSLREFVQGHKVTNINIDFKRRVVESILNDVDWKDTAIDDFMKKQKLAYSACVMKFANVIFVRCLIKDMIVAIDPT
ncbi:uncharacterized protein MONOS_11775 [Monocercomonoides exilis]|uniref:uncharacterized protein n=1 Tax=Monocercomonoides exilis TaxID=2049356 RepID=UPI0035598409|nr:hypothetical protein MONOS_11775 [Monocercomonoides exilis]|eukprot:MONOS_11775.1-p1 / transcript=MONOS_11775.1 / gene=MONOS_11775 / organism=Monocercomonoides_exilis_PA203 / gene_product=unspecified product / transcript_product=unspecified product / location=Mono_scaffold00610:7215-7865(+) / protein_length=217 / sequence_SO=supercontig / SO=protein_coding / is_pseudo=false